MPCEIGLSDGTKIQVDQSRHDVEEDLQRLAGGEREAGATAVPYGDWMQYGGTGMSFNPAHVVYVKDIEDGSGTHLTWS